MLGTTTNICYMQAFPDRKAETLLGIIQEHTLPHLTIWSDLWSSYNKISELHKKQIEHRTVNHSYNFFDPDDFTCTNKIEGVSCLAKSHLKEMRGCRRVYIQGYLDEFIWRYNNNISCNEAHIKLLEAIANVYRTNPNETFENINDGDDIGDDIPDFVSFHRNKT